MGFSNFLFKHVLPNLPEYLLILSISTLIIIIIYRGIVCSIWEFGILWGVFFGVIFSLTDCIFLYQNKLIRQHYFINFVVTTGVYYFIICFLHIHFKIRQIYNKFAVGTGYKFDNSAIVYGWFLFVLWLFLIVFNIRIFGIRNFNKLGGGSGLIVRLLWIVNPLLIYTIVYLFIKGRRKHRMIVCLFLILYAINAFLSISKSSILRILTACMTFYFLNPSEKGIKHIVKKYGVLLLCVSIIFGSLLLSFMNDTNMFEGILGLLYRFVAFGDVYTFAYPNQIADKIRGNIDVPFMKYLFSSLLPMYRLANYESFMDCNIPGMLVERVAGKGIAEGPNSRFNVVGYIFWGFEGSILFATLCAIIFFGIHTIFIMSVNKTYKKQLFAYFMASSLISIEQDSALIPQFLGAIPLVVIIIVCISLLLMSSKNTIHSI